MPLSERQSKIDWRRSDKWPRFDTPFQNNFIDTTPTPTLGEIYPQLSDLRTTLASRDIEKKEHFHEIIGLLLDGFCISDFHKNILQNNKNAFSDFLYGYFEGKVDK